ncbi:MAG: phosphatase PAP2 family protein [Frankiaceae bacterium]|nr:phosphatase PAP2 family protein [Frankiaceae bacterium]
MTQLYDAIVVTGPRVPAAPSRHALRAAAAQVGALAVAFVAYFGARGLTEADPSKAIEHAQAVVDFEQRLGLHGEAALQQLVLGHANVIDVLNWIYIWGHWPVIIGVLIWLLNNHPQPYRLLRNALFVSGAIGIVIFVLYPVAPPRLAGLGLVDTITSQSHAYRVLQPPAFVNQYAAIPSLHVGWDLLVGIFIFRYARRWVLRLLGALTPLAMTASVVLTANHFVIDAVLGALVAMIGLSVAVVTSRHR